MRGSEETGGGDTGPIGRVDPGARDHMESGGRGFSGGIQSFLAIAQAEDGGVKTTAPYEAEAAELAAPVAGAQRGGAT